MGRPAADVLRGSTRLDARRDDYAGGRHRLRGAAGSATPPGITVHFRKTGGTCPDVLEIGSRVGAARRSPPTGTAA